METEIIKSLIQDDVESLRKKDMYDGINYYRGYNDILKRDFREFFVEGKKYIDENKSNTHIVNNYQKKLTDQEVGYIIGKPVTIEAEDEVFAEKVITLLGEKRHDTFSEWIKGAINKGYDSLHPFRDEDGEFDYVVMPGEELIFIYDTSYQKKLLNVVRYYKMEWEINGETKELYRVEVWDEEKVTMYQENTEGDYDFIVQGTYGVEINPRYHWYTYYYNDIENMKTDVEAHGWGRIPIVKLSNNSEEIPTLKMYKSYIDAMDVVASGFVNDLRDVQLAIWVLRGYEGEDLSEFMYNLQTFKAISLSNSDSSSAEPKSIEIPKEARVALLEWLEKKIYQVGQGVNETDIEGGSITNVAIRAMYAGLDIKSNILITKLKAALQEFMYFVTEYINERDNASYDYKTLEFTFNKSMIFNELEIVEMLAKSVGIISNHTIIANHPLVKNLADEKEWLKQEEEERMTALGGDLGFGGGE